MCGGTGNLAFKFIDQEKAHMGSVRTTELSLDTLDFEILTQAGWDSDCLHVSCWICVMCGKKKELNI